MPNSVGENRTKRKLTAGQLVLFMGVNQMRTPNIAMIAASCGFDGVYIDLEHNPTSLETAATICIAALGLGITPIVRVSSRDPHDATRILDCGRSWSAVSTVRGQAIESHLLGHTRLDGRCSAAEMGSIRRATMHPSDPRMREAFEADWPGLGTERMRANGWVSAASARISNSRLGWCSSGCGI